MLNWLKARSRTRRKADELYGVVVAAARSPGYYLHFRVPDTPEGRYELVALCLFLLCERLKTVEGAGERLAQAAIEAFVGDMDDCMREMGVGDLTVPKRVRRAAAGFYERAGRYREGLRQGEGVLAEALATFAFANAGTADLLSLAKHVARAAEHLEHADDAAILDGRALAVLKAPTFTSVPEEATTP